MDPKKLKLSKQPLLPPLQTKEVLAALIYLALSERQELAPSADTAERRKHCVQSLVEYALQEGALSESDVIPF